MTRGHMSKPRRRRKRQFRTTSKPKDHYDKKIRHTGRDGAGRTLAVGRIIPKNWQYIRVWKAEPEGNVLTLKIECLLKVPSGDTDAKHAQRGIKRR